MELEVLYEPCQALFFDLNWHHGLRFPLECWVNQTHVCAHALRRTLNHQDESVHRCRMFAIGVERHFALIWNENPPMLSFPEGGRGGCITGNRARCEPASFPRQWLLGCTGDPLPLPPARTRRTRTSWPTICPCRCAWGQPRAHRKNCTWFCPRRDRKGAPAPRPLLRRFCMCKPY
jgi:hypothetical protein